MIAARAIAILLVACATVGAAPASDKAKTRDVIRIGELTIHGQVRRPSIDLYQLKTLGDDQLKSIAEMQFAEYERSLLESLEAKPAPERSQR